MKIGLPKETQAGEKRIALAPDAVAALVTAGHEVLIETDAGTAAGFADSLYAEAGARVVEGAASAYLCDLLLKVKPPTPAEWRHLAPNSTLFCFLNLPSDRELAATLLSQRINTIAFDTVEDRNGRLPILAPMSTIAGEVAITMASHYLLAPQGGRGISVKNARVVILGAGTVGTAAAKTALALGADVTVISNPSVRMARLAHQLGMNARTVVASAASITQALIGADVVVGAINSRGAATSRLINRAHLRSMGTGAVMVDVCIDGGGISETSRATSLLNPSFIEEGVIHVGIPNLPASVPRSASIALSAAIAPHAEAIASKGLALALRENAGLASGLQLAAGQVTHKAVAASLGRPWVDSDALLFAC